MLHRAKGCGCEKEIGMSKAHIPQSCEHKNLFEYVHGLKISEKGTSARKPRKSMKRSQPKRDWSDARAKVDEEQVCRVCGSNEQVEAAHIIGRHADQLKPGLASGPLWVNPDSIVPLCGSYSRLKCHPSYDAHALDILEFLTLEEQVQAVKDAGGIESARMRVSPSSYRILPDRSELNVDGGGDAARENLPIPKSVSREKAT